MNVHVRVTGGSPSASGGPSHAWDKRVETWDHSAVPGLRKIADAVLRHAGPVRGLDVVDLGCGSGQLTLALAREARSVTAVDFSAAMLLRLEERASATGMVNVETVLASLQLVDLAPESVDVIVSNYALHHLRDRQKTELLGRAVRWLRPGGVMVVGDMMFSVRGGPEDRRILAAKIASMARRGPAGWWRIAKNAWRFTAGRQECPVSVGAWESMLNAAGLSGIRSEHVVAEGAVVSGRRSER